MRNGEKMGIILEVSIEINGMALQLHNNMKRVSNHTPNVNMRKITCGRYIR